MSALGDVVNEHGDIKISEIASAMYGRVQLNREQAYYASQFGWRVVRTLNDRGDTLMERSEGERPI